MPVTKKNRELAASAEMITACAAFILGAIAYMSIEGWMGTTLLVLGGAAALGALWVARWEDEGQRMARLRPPGAQPPRQHASRAVRLRSPEQELALSAEVILGVAAFTVGAVAYIAIGGTFGLILLALGAAAAVGSLWAARDDAEVEFQLLRVERTKRQL